MTGNKEPLPTIMQGGVRPWGGRKRDRADKREVMCEDAPVSKYQSVFCGWFSVVVLMAEASDCWSQAGRPASGL